MTADRGSSPPRDAADRPTVVLTRSAIDNRSSAERLVAAGMAVVEIPLQEVLPSNDGGRALRSAVDRLDRYRYVVITSVNGVDAVAVALADRPWPTGVEVAAVGPATAAAAASRGWPVGPVPEVATGAALVDVVPPVPGRASDATGGGRTEHTGATRWTVLAALAELADDTVVDGLNARGYRVDRVEAYRTGPPEVTGDQLRQQTAAVGAADLVAFASPSAVDRFVERFGLDGVPPTVVCIGPRTGSRAVELGLEPVVADLHTQDGLIDAVLAWTGG